MVTAVLPSWYFWLLLWLALGLIVDARKGDWELLHPFPHWNTCKYVQLRTTTCKYMQIIDRGDTLLWLALGSIVDARKGDWELLHPFLHWNMCKYVQLRANTCKKLTGGTHYSGWHSARSLMPGRGIGKGPPRGFASHLRLYWWRLYWDWLWLWWFQIFMKNKLCGKMKYEEYSPC